MSAALRVAAYIRVSTEAQASDEHFSIPEQTDRVKAYCAAKGWELVKIYTDPGYSGKNLDRPAIRQLISECRQYDLVLVNKLDRLSRSQKDTLYLIEDVFMANGVQFASMTENFDTTTPLGMAMVGILSTFAQLERNQIKERMMTGKIGRAKKGLYNGGVNVPTGYDYKDGAFIPNESAEDVREVFRLFLSGMSIRAIGRTMQEKPHISAWMWDNKTISRILRNPTYIGKIRYKGEVYDAPHEPIIDAETFERAQERYALLDRNNPNWQNPTTKLLTGIIYCGECGSRYCLGMSKTRSKSGRVYVYEYYSCYAKYGRLRNHKKENCGSKNIKKDVLEQYIIEQIESLSITPVKEDVSPPDNSKQIAKLEKQKNRLIDLYSLETINMDELKKRLEKIDAKLLALTTPEEKHGLSDEAVSELVTSARSVFESGDIADCRRVITSLIRKITIYADRIIIDWNFDF